MLPVAAHGTVPLQAKAGTSTFVSSPREAFQRYYEVDLPEMVIPQVIEAVLPRGTLIDADMAVYDATAGKFVYSSQRITSPTQQKLLVSSQPMMPNSSRLADMERGPSARVVATKDPAQPTQLVITADPALETESIHFLRRATSALPLDVEVSVGEGNDMRVVRPLSPSQGDILRFDKTFASTWTLRFTNSQDLLIDEIAFGDMSSTGPSPSMLFLAEPAHEYLIYGAADRAPRLPRVESVNLLSGKQPLRVEVIDSKNNPLYVAADSDLDGIEDGRDNCVLAVNVNQEDKDGNRLGDACEDFDLDGVMGVSDNCKDTPNRDQKDADADGVGDACDDEEDRLLARYPWLPWLGIAIAGVVIVSLFMLTAFATRLPEEVADTVDGDTGSKA